MDQREEVREDGESPSHFPGIIRSAGVAGGEASKLRCPALFLADMPDSGGAPGFEHFAGAVLTPEEEKKSLAAG